MEIFKWANDCGGKDKKSLPKLLSIDKDTQKSHWEIHDTHSGTDTLKTTDIPNVISVPCKLALRRHWLVIKGLLYNFEQQCNGNFTPRYFTQEIVTNVYKKCEQPFSLQFCLWYKQYEARQAEGRKGVAKQKGHFHANIISHRSSYCINTEEFQVMLK